MNETMTAKEKKEPQSSQDATTPLGSVDQIRDIIFGAQMRDYEERFAVLEARLIDEARALREDIQNRFHVLEDNLATERDERGAATGRVIDELHATAKSIDQRSEKNRQDLLDELAQTREAILTRLDALQDAKTDRAALSGLLREMAAELDGAARDGEELDNESTAPADDSGEPG